MIDTDFFELFAMPLSFQQDLAEIKRRYYQLQQKIHPDNFVNATPQEKRLAVSYTAKVNEGYQILTDPLQRAIYLLKIMGIDTQNETDTSMPMDFLMEQMEYREQISSPDYDKSLIKEKIYTALTDCEKNIAEFLDKAPQQLEAARLCVRKMQFYRRLCEEI